MMTRITDSIHSPFEGELSVITSLCNREMDAAMLELKREDETNLALRHALRQGITIDDLSAASGLTPSEIRRRVAREPRFGDDLVSLTGVR